jgi:uncharacterized membrane protein YhaH (DUF805 family)
MEPVGFFSINGRTGPIRFLVVFGVIVLTICMVAQGFGKLEAEMFPLLGAVGGAAFAKLFAEAGRRCHDRNWSAMAGALVLVGTFTALVSILSLVIDGTMAIAVGMVATFVFAATFLIPGQGTANAYGEPPSEALRAGRVPAGDKDRRSPAWAAVSILGCATLGLAVQMITDQIRADRESRGAAWGPLPSTDRKD